MRLVSLGLFAGVAIVVLLHSDRSEPVALRPGVTMENARRLRAGMTLQEIEKVMGRPGIKGWYVESPEVPVTWQGDGFEVCVCFYDFSRGAAYGLISYPGSYKMESLFPPETFFGRFRRWLGL